MGRSRKSNSSPALKVPNPAELIEEEARVRARQNRVQRGPIFLQQLIRLEEGFCHMGLRGIAPIGTAMLGPRRCGSCLTA